MGHKVSVCLTFWGTAKLSQGSLHQHSHQQCMQVPCFLHPYNFFKQRKLGFCSCLNWTLHPQFPVKNRAQGWGALCSESTSCSPKGFFLWWGFNFGSLLRMSVLLLLKIISLTSQPWLTIKITQGSYWNTHFQVLPGRFWPSCFEVQPQQSVFLKNCGVINI